jgi:hypothetical protein
MNFVANVDDEIVTLPPTTTTVRRDPVDLAGLQIAMRANQLKPTEPPPSRPMATAPPDDSPSLATLEVPVLAPESYEIGNEVHFRTEQGEVQGRVHARDKDALVVRAPNGNLTRVSGHETIPLEKRPTTWPLAGGDFYNEPKDWMSRARIEKYIAQSAREAESEASRAQTIDNAAQFTANLNPFMGVPNFLLALGHLTGQNPLAISIPYEAGNEPAYTIPRTPRMHDATAEQMLGKSGAATVKAAQGVVDGLSSFGEGMLTMNLAPSVFVGGAGGAGPRIMQAAVGMDAANHLAPAAEQLGETAAFIEQQLQHSQYPDIRKFMEELTGVGLQSGFAGGGAIRGALAGRYLTRDPLSLTPADKAALEALRPRVNGEPIPPNEFRIVDNDGRQLMSEAPLGEKLPPAEADTRPESTNSTPAPPTTLEPQSNAPALSKPEAPLWSAGQHQLAEALALRRLESRNAGALGTSLGTQRAQLEILRRRHEAIRQEINEANSPELRQSLENSLRQIESGLEELATGLPRTNRPRQAPGDDQFSLADEPKPSKLNPDENQGQALKEDQKAVAGWVASRNLWGLSIKAVLGDFRLRSGGPESRATAEAFKAFEKVLGVRIVFYAGGRRIEGGVDPQQPGVLFIRQSTPHTPYVVLGHELLESIVQTRPDLYANLHNRLIPLMEKVPEYREKLLERRKLADRNDPVSDAFVERELIADFVGDNLAKPDFWRRLAREDKGLFTHVAEVFQDLLAKVHIALKPYGATKYFRDVERAERAVSQVLAEFARTPELRRKPGEIAEDRYSIEPDPEAQPFKPPSNSPPDIGYPNVLPQHFLSKAREMGTRETGEGRYLDNARKTDILLRLAKQSGLQSIPTRSLGRSMGNTEHEVWPVQNQDGFIKMLRPQTWRDPFEYLKNLRNLTQVTPELGIRIIGIKVAEDGSPQIIHFENRINGEHPSTYVETADILSRHGYTPTGRPGDWITPEKKFLLRDVYKDNILIDATGRPRVIDATVVPTIRGVPPPGLGNRRFFMPDSDVDDPPRDESSSSYTK